ncbi:hypothetical protein [Polaromonas sp. JS666]|uniref:hypothetical protein n=1 Tax=Polaromonas sp. (strain JS666 / ATCC BAA-500) TaxID=296591 RepID=UPI00005335CD|nr:hypothetical protein [Polaromonas sp. JS666]ABE45675.1 hypothetical protein Bpro_3776 [Polaromonas sp. JS666]
MRSLGLAVAAMAAIAGAGLGSHVVLAGDAPGLSQSTQRAINKSTQNPDKQAANKMRAMLGGGVGSWSSRQRRAGYGWTNRHAQRVALKKRNVKRHRAASK